MFWIFVSIAGLAATFATLGMMKSKQQKDAEAVDRLAREFGESPAQPASASDQARARFNAALGSTIDVKFAEIMNGKAEANKFLTNPLDMLYCWV